MGHVKGVCERAHSDWRPQVTPQPGMHVRPNSTVQSGCSATKIHNGGQGTTAASKTVQEVRDHSRDAQGRDAVHWGAAEATDPFHAARRFPWQEPEITCEIVRLVERTVDVRTCVAGLNHYSFSAWVSTGHRMVSDAARPLTGSFATCGNTPSPINRLENCTIN